MQHLSVSGSSRNHTYYSEASGSGHAAESQGDTSQSIQTVVPATPVVRDEKAILQELVERNLKIKNFDGTPADAINIAKENLNSQEDEIQPFQFLKELLSLIHKKEIKVSNSYDLYSFLSAEQLILLGDETAKSEKSKHLFYLFAGRKKSSLAMFKLAELALKGAGGAVQNDSLAFSFCKSAISNEYAPVYPGAYYLMGELVEQGKGTAANIDAAVVHYSAAANAGFPLAYWRLSNYFSDKALLAEHEMTRMHAVGLHLEYLDKAVEAKIPEALLQKGLFLFRDPIESESKRGFQYIQEAAGLGNADANFWLGNHYYEDEETEALSFPYFEDAYHLGKKEAIGILGDIYFEGEITQKNLGLAIELYDEAIAYEGDSSRYWRKLVIAKVEQDPNLEREVPNSRELAEIYLLYKSDSYEVDQDLGKAMGAIKALMERDMGSFSQYIASKLIDINEFNANLEQTKKFNELFNQLKESNNLLDESLQNIADNYIPQIPEIRSEMEKKLIEMKGKIFNRLFDEDDSDDAINLLSLSFINKLDALILTKRLLITTKISEFTRYKKDIIQECDKTPHDLPLVSNSKTLKDVTNKLRAVKGLIEKMTNYEYSIEHLYELMDEQFDQIEVEGEQLIADFEKEKAKIVLQREQMQEFEQKKERAYEFLVEKEKQLGLDLAIHQEESASCLQRSREAFDALEFSSDDADSQIRSVMMKFDTALDEFSIAAWKERNRVQKQEHQSKMQEMQQRAERAEAKLLAVNGEKYAEASASSRTEKEEIERLKKELHEAKKIVAQATERAAREVDNIKKSSAQQLEQQKQIADKLRTENSELKAIVQNIPETTNIEILQKRIQRRIDELKTRGITGFKEYQFNSFPPRAYNLDGLEAILFGIGFKQQGDANGSHRHYERGTDGMGLSPHSSAEADKAQIQQVLNFLLSDLNSIK